VLPFFNGVGWMFDFIAIALETPFGI
jgi:hypothetical protein